MRGWERSGGGRGGREVGKGGGNGREGEVGEGIRGEGEVAPPFLKFLDPSLARGNHNYYRLLCL